MPLPLRLPARLPHHTPAVLVVLSNNREGSGHIHPTAAAACSCVTGGPVGGPAAVLLVRLLLPLAPAAAGGAAAAAAGGAAAAAAALAAAAAAPPAPPAAARAAAAAAAAMGGPASPPLPAAVSVAVGPCLPIPLQLLACLIVVLLRVPHRAGLSPRLDAAARQLPGLLPRLLPLPLLLPLLLRRSSAVLAGGAIRAAPPLLRLPRPCGVARLFLPLRGCLLAAGGQGQQARPAGPCLGLYRRKILGSVGVLRLQLQGSFQVICRQGRQGAAASPGQAPVSSQLSSGSRAQTTAAGPQTTATAALLAHPSPSKATPSSPSKATPSLLL